MPYKSQAQRRLFHWLQAQGKLSPSTVEEYDKATKGKSIPEYVKRKAFGGEVSAEHGARCPTCDFPLDQIPVAMDAGEACPRCGNGWAKDVPQRKASGGEVMDPTAYRAMGGYIPLKARGGDACPHCGGDLYGDMKELYPKKPEHGADLDDGHPRISFGMALKTRRR